MRISHLAALIVLAVVCGASAATEPGAGSVKLDQKEYALHEPVYLLASPGAFRCGQETLLRLDCLPCQAPGKDCACREQRRKAPCRQALKSGGTEAWEFAQDFTPGHYRLKVAGRPEPLDFYVRAWAGSAPMELELETDMQVYGAEEEAVVTLRNTSDHPVYVYTGCFDTPVRLREAGSGFGPGQPHACVAAFPRSSGDEPGSDMPVAATVLPDRSLQVHLRMPVSSSLQLTPYVEFKRAPSLPEYIEKFGTQDPSGFRGTKEALPVSVLPRG